MEKQQAAAQNGRGAKPNAESEATAAPTKKMVVLRDYWPTGKDQDRVRAGSIIDVPVDEALNGLEAGRYAVFRE